LLQARDLAPGLSGLRQLPVRETLRPLLSLLSEPGEELRMRAVKALGIQVARLADEDGDAAREVMRRLIWNLNEESGSSGWGAPEAMAEIMANHPGMAGEYAHLLVSYMHPGGNYLEHSLLQRGLLLGLGRLAEIRPHLLRQGGACRHLPDYFQSHDPAVRGLAAWCAGLLCDFEIKTALAPLLGDGGELSIWRGEKWQRARVADLAREALDRLAAAASPAAAIKT